MSCTNTWDPSRITGTSWKSTVASQAGYALGYEGQRSLPNREVTRMEDKNRNKITVAEAAEYLGVTRTTVQQMVERGVLKADRFAGAIHIPREEVERIERETAP